MIEEVGRWAVLAAGIYFGIGLFRRALRREGVNG
jgi:hypothetical protein